MRKKIFAVILVIAMIVLASCDQPKAPEDGGKAPLAYIDDFRLYKGEEVIFSEDFQKAESAEKFCPYHTGDNPDESTHDSFVGTFKVQDGVAKAYANSAWISFKDLDAKNNEYEIVYRIKLDKSYSLSPEEGTKKATTLLTMNYGNKNDWTSECYSFSKDEDGLYIYDSSPSVLNDTKYKLEPETWYTISTKYAPFKDGETVKIRMTTSILIGDRTKTINEAVFNAADKAAYCWDIYFPAPAAE